MTGAQGAAPSQPPPSEPLQPDPGPPEPLFPTPSQTVGPFLGIALPWPDGPWVADTGAEGAITITGQVLDGAGRPVPDALVETWQAAPGRQLHPSR